MRRITLWLTATLAVLAMITYYQASLSGDGKHAESRSDAPVAADCGSARPQATTSSPTATTSTPSTEDKAGDACANSDHSGKPGESR
jgi:hypothetical protein